MSVDRRNIMFVTYYKTYENCQKDGGVDFAVVYYKTVALAYALINL